VSNFVFLSGKKRFNHKGTPRFSRRYTKGITGKDQTVILLNN